MPRRQPLPTRAVVVADDVAYRAVAVPQLPVTTLKHRDPGRIGAADGGEVLAAAGRGQAEGGLSEAGSAGGDGVAERCGADVENGEVVEPFGVFVRIGRTSPLRSEQFSGRDSPWRERAARAAAGGLDLPQVAIGGHGAGFRKATVDTGLRRRH